MIYLQDPDVTVHCGDVLDVLPTLPAGSVDCVVTSPPYWGLRDYGTGEWEGGDPECDHRQTLGGTRNKGRDRAASGGTFHDSPVVADALGVPYRDVCGKCGARRIDRQIGLEQSFDEFVETLVGVFREVRRVLAPHGTCWLNLGDSYAGSLHGAPPQARENVPPSLTSGSDLFVTARGGTHTPPGLKPKDLCGIPWRLALALQADGWWLRADIIWSKPNPMPESVTDRPTKAHEYVFLLTKQARYFYDADAVREPAIRAGDRIVGDYTGRDIDAGVNGGWLNGGTVPAGRNLRSVWTIPTQPFSARELFGGDGRITSPDCPVHGDHRRRVTTGGRDGHAGASLPDTSYSDTHPEQGPLVDSAPTDPLRGPDSARGSSDSPDPSSSPVATPRSSGSRRTAPAPATSSPCIASAQTSGRTDDTQASPGNGEPFDHTSESRNAQGDSGAHPSAETPSHNVRRSSCTCHYIDHFATYPGELVRRCLLAGCPERVCSTCGKPSERIVERESSTPPTYRDAGVETTLTAGRNRNVTRMGDGYDRVETVGWSDCGHNNWRPGVVLDPFLGSGTTAHVARKHGRHAIGIELNPEYCELAARRLAQLSLLAEGAA